MKSINVEVNDYDYLRKNLAELPYFRALLRAVESRFYLNIDLQNPVLDLGCGDGHFAKSTFSQIRMVGIDPLLSSLQEAKKAHFYLDLIQSGGANLPFRSSTFKSCISNSVLEHIPKIDRVLGEISRVLASGSMFVFCVPNPSFTKNLSIALFLNHIHLIGLAKLYRKFFNRISRHYHCDSFDIWKRRLEVTGFEILDHWDYFSPAALSCLEWGHYLGFPYWLSRKIFGKWVLWPKLNQELVYHCVKRFYLEAPKQINGAYSFYIARKK
jgi:ubiquinone/menaquinone biosynthesis C-methylase UbiE